MKVSRFSWPPKVFHFTLLFMSFSEWAKQKGAIAHAPSPSRASEASESSGFGAQLSGMWTALAGKGSPGTSDVEGGEQGQGQGQGQGGAGGSAAGGYFSAVFAGTPAAPAAPAESDWTCGLTRAQRFQAFVIALVGGAVFIGLALVVFLPLVLFVPSKFAFSFTLGSLLFMLAFALLRGPRAVFRQLMSRDKAAFTAAYFVSIALTLYAALGMRSYVVVIFASGCQIAALLWYGAAFVPGGTTGMRFLTKAVSAAVRKVCCPFIQMVCSRCVKQ